MNSLDNQGELLGYDLQLGALADILQFTVFTEIFSKFIFTYIQKLENIT